MTKEDFIDNVKRIVANYAENRDVMVDDPQLRVNPLLMSVSVVTGREMQNEIAFTDEDVEAGAAAEGDETESSDDYEAKQDPDFYPLRQLLKDGAVEAVAANYFK